MLLECMWLCSAETEFGADMLAATSAGVVASAGGAGGLDEYPARKV